MKAIGYSIPFMILFCGVVGLVGLSHLKKDPPQSPRTKQSALVEVRAVEACVHGFNITVDGEVVPFREINLAAEVEGRIAAKSSKARAGNYIHTGELLFQIDKRDYELEVRRLQETVNQAGSSIEELDVEKANGPDLKLLFNIDQLPGLLFLDHRGRVLEEKQGAAYHSELISMASAALVKGSLTVK